MKDVTVNRTSLIEIVKKNRAEHRAIFDEAVVSYGKALEAELERRLADIRAGKRGVRVTVLPVPVDHTKDYDRIVQMLEMCVEETVVLAERDAAQYVMDDWTWKREFMTSSSNYGVKAAMDYMETVN